VIEERKNLRKR